MSKQMAVAAFMAALSISAQAFEPLPTKAPVPADNPMTDAKIELGKQLYFDPRLSLDGTISCNSCHNVMSSGTDNRSVSVGVAGAKGGRSAPTVWNAAFLSSQFWDGRAASLEDQAKGPILAHVEMAMPSADEAVKRIQSIPGYVTSFKKVFGGKQPVTYDNIAKAIATYERTLITPNSAYDRYVRGDNKAMSKQAIRGMKTVESVGCTSCHNGPNFSGPDLPVGTPFLQKFPAFPGSKYDSQYDLTSDLGRYNVTKDKADRNMWRVPTWRNVAVTAPYFHNGKVETLEEAIRVMAKTQLDKTLSKKEVADIAAFLNSLTGEFPAQTLPRLPDYNNGSIVKID